MKFTIERAILFKALVHAGSIVEKKNTIPILANVKITANENAVNLQTTNTDIELIENIPAIVDEAGIITASALKLYMITSRLPEGSQIEFTLNDNKELLIKCGKIKYKIATLPADDFYSMPEVELPFTFMSTTTTLKDMINKTGFAAATEETRHYLNGIYMHDNSKDNEKTMRVAATDGHRLACLELPIPKGAEGMPGIIIPKKTISELVKLFESSDMDVEVSLSPNKIRFAMKDIVFSSKLIEGTYPDYERVIPTNNDKKIEVDASEFKAAVDRVSIFEKSRGIKVLIEDGRMRLSANIPDEGSADAEIEVDYQGEIVEFGFNHKYLLDILDQIKTGKTNFTFSESTSPVVIYDGEKTSSVYVLMPMRI